MLYVKRSQIPKGGKGLFTDEFIKKGTYVVEYLGEIITWKEVLKRSEAGRGGYAFYVSDRKCIDAFNTPQHFAQFANDARGTGRHSKLRNNCVYDEKRSRGFIQATRNIKPGEEILVWYGPDYWKEHIEEQKLFSKRRRSEAAKKAWKKRKKAGKKTKKK